MADKPVKYQEVYEKDLFNNFIKSADEALKTLDKISEGFKEVLKTTSEISKQKVFTDIEALKKREKAIEDNRKAIEGLDKIEKERLRLEERLKNATDERAKANASLRLQIQQANKEAKESVKIEGDLGAYAQKSATLNKLRKSYKDLASQYGTNNKEAKELLKEVQKLDKELKDLDSTVGQNQRNVGNYEGAVNKLTGSLKLLSKVAVIGVLTKLVETFRGSEEGAKALDKALLEVTVRVSLFVTAITQAFQGIDQNASLLDKISQFFSNASDNLSDFNEEVGKALKSNKALVDAELNSLRTISSLTVELSKLVVVQSKFQSASADSTLSLEEQSKALGNFQKISRDIATLQLEIATREEAIARQRVKANKEKTGLDKASVDLEKALADAILNRANSEAELANVISENAKTARQVASDEIELQLDVLQDAAERQRNIRDRLIADEKIDLAERARLLELSNEDTKNAFNAEIRLIEDLNKQRLLSLSSEKLQLRDSLNEFEGTEKKRRELTEEAIALQEQALSFTLDSNKLISENNTVLLNEELKQLNLSEAIRTRVIQSINDRRDALQENEEARKALTESEREANEQEQINLLTTRALFDLQEEGVNLNKVLNQLQDDRLQAEIDALQQRLVIAEQGSAEVLAIQAELNEKLLQQQQQRIAEQIKKERQAFEAVLEISRELFTKRLDAQDKAIDKELSAVQQRQDALRAISRQGQADAEEALAFEQRKEAELERKKEQQARRRARLELALSAVETYSNKVEAGVSNPLASTITDISLLQAFVSSLPAFYEGAENVSDALGLPKLQGVTRDPYLARLHGGERVVNDRDNALLPNDMSNSELVNAGIWYREFGRSRESTSNTIVNTISKDDFREVMYDAIERMPRNSLDYDPVERAIIEVIERKGRTERKHKKTGGIW